MSKKEFGLIGYPLSHSFSQKYFTGKFKRENITDAIFHAFSIPTINDLETVLTEHPLLEGFAITIPYKREVIPFLYQASPEVITMNACNCVRIRKGKLYGYNTDIIGFEKSFAKHLQPHHKKALVLGTGGAASAVKFTLEKLGISFMFVSRTRDEAKGMLGYGNISESLLKEFTIIINCTPLGTYPDVNVAPELPYHGLTNAHYLFDLVYNPPKTKFLSHGEERGATIQNGYEMLVLQAEENWKIWNS